MPRKLITAMPRLLKNFIALESSSGIIMIAAAVVAILIANSPIASSYNTLQALPLSLLAWVSGMSPYHLKTSLKTY